MSSLLYAYIIWNHFAVCGICSTISKENNVPYREQCLPWMIWSIKLCNCMFSSSSSKYQGKQYFINNWKIDQKYLSGPLNITQQRKLEQTTGFFIKTDSFFHYMRTQYNCLDIVEDSQPNIRNCQKVNSSEIKILPFVFSSILLPLECSVVYVVLTMKTIPYYSEGNL